MECSPDLGFYTTVDNEFYKDSGDMYHQQLLQSGVGGNSDMNTKATKPDTFNRQRKTNFSPREIEVLLSAVNKRRENTLNGTPGNQAWAKAWQEIAEEVSAAEDIQRTESEVRKKWTYLKWEAKHTSKPTRDRTSRTVLEILSAGYPKDAATIGAKSLLKDLHAPQQPVSTNRGHTWTPSPVPIKSKNIAARPTPSPSPQDEQLPEVSLKWNSYQRNMQTFFPSLLNNEQFVDVTLACEGQSIKCHKVLLSACSNYFHELFSENPCQHPIVLMKGFCFWEIQALVDFMYKGEVNILQDKLPQLLKAAEGLQIKGLGGPTFGNCSNTNEDDLHSSTNNSDGASSSDGVRRQRKRKVYEQPRVQIPVSYHNTPTSHSNASTTSAHLPTYSVPPKGTRTSNSPHDYCAADFFRTTSSTTTPARHMIAKQSCKPVRNSSAIIKSENVLDNEIEYAQETEIFSNKNVRYYDEESYEEDNNRFWGSGSVKPPPAKSIGFHRENSTQLPDFEEIMF